MDIAYDHIQEEALAPDGNEATSGRETQQNLNDELGQAFKAVSSSAWGTKLGGWFGQARRQGESFYQDLQKEASVRSEQATKGFEQATKSFETLREQVVNRTRSLTLSAEPTPLIPGEEGIPEIITTDTTEGGADRDDTAARAEALSADIVREAGSLVASLRSTAAAKLKDLQRAEDAADEALLKFGANVRNFLRDAVIISAPGEGDADRPKGIDGAGNEVLFETHEPGTGKKVFHTTRLDAQLHAIHTTATSFTQDPQGDEWDAWQKKFDIEKQTTDIAADLDKYEELRQAMEKLVPEKVEYRIFWMRYYFLRAAIQEEERRRKEVLKGAVTDTEEEVKWDDDDEEDDNKVKTDASKAQTDDSKAKTDDSKAKTDDSKIKPVDSTIKTNDIKIKTDDSQAKINNGQDEDDEEDEEEDDDEDEDEDEEDDEEEDDDEDDDEEDDSDDSDEDEDEDETDEDTSTPRAVGNAASASTSTLNAPPNNTLLKPRTPRRSEEHEKQSVAGSDASYDIVSGATTGATGSPREDRKEVSKDESDDDWE